MYMYAYIHRPALTICIIQIYVVAVCYRIACLLPIQISVEIVCMSIVCM